MAEALTPGPASPPPRSRHAPTFAVLTGALVGIAIGAVVLAVALASGGRAGGPPADWSTWAPAGGGSVAQEIANHVAPEYRLDDGQQLAAVTGGTLELASLPAHVALRSTSGDVSIVEGSSLLFTLCGGGLDCSIRSGKPTVERMLLLKREALELALYAFQFTKTDNVVTLLPPRAPAEGKSAPKSSASGATATATPQGTALVFRRDQLSTSLKEPLDVTLPAQVPTVSTVEHAPEAGLVKLITKRNLFLVESIVKGQDASAFLVLDALS